MTRKPLDQIDFARDQRRSPTDAEARLWLYIRRRQLAGQRFRRQHPIGPYIADFACFERQLVIELDGDQHDANRQYDQRRDRYMTARGFQVLRFPSYRVFNDLEAVLDTIHEALIKRPPRTERE